MKDFIRNSDGKIKNCPKNIARMNLFQVVWFSRDILFSFDKSSFYEILKGFLEFLFLVVFFAFYPISILVHAWFIRHNYRKEVEKFEKMDNSNIYKAVFNHKNEA